MTNIHIKYFKILYPNVHLEPYVFFHPKGLSNKVFYQSIVNTILVLNRRKAFQGWPAEKGMSFNISSGKLWVLGKSPNILNRLKIKNIHES